MDQALFITAAVFFGLVSAALWIYSFVSRKGKGENREVGYRRAEIQIDAGAVPEFKPTWQNLRDKSEAR
jgi:hypothetical protein